MNYVSYMGSAFLHCLFFSKSDVVIATSPQFFCGRAGVLLRWFRRFPTILELRDIWSESIASVNAGLLRWVLGFAGWMEKVMYGSAKHIVTGGDGLPMEPENAEELVSLLKQLYNDSALCDKLGRNGFESICRKYNRNQQAEDYSTFLQNLFPA